MTAEQLDLKARIIAASAEHLAARRKLRSLEILCTHSFVKENNTGVCEICGYTGGWWCDTSPSHVCMYTKGNNCDHCGHLYDRK